MLRNFSSCSQREGKFCGISLSGTPYPIPYTPLSRHQHCSTGTTNIVILWISIPPKAGIAIGIIMSAHLPVDVSTGSSAMRVVAVVIAAGRTLFKPAITTASRMSLRGRGVRSRKVS